MTREYAKHAVGELVHHLLFDYRGVVFDVDQVFQGDEEWYRTMARTCPPRNRPWYHVLVHGATHTTYVAERNLEADASGQPIDHPLVARLFAGFRNGRYIAARDYN